MLRLRLIPTVVVPTKSITSHVVRCGEQIYFEQIVVGVQPVRVVPISIAAQPPMSVSLPPRPIGGRCRCPFDAVVRDVADKHVVAAAADEVFNDAAIRERELEQRVTVCATLPRSKVTDQPDVCDRSMVSFPPNAVSMIVSLPSLASPS